jgi:hypothetical protein
VGGELPGGERGGGMSHHHNNKMINSRHRRRRVKMQMQPGLRGVAREGAVEEMMRMNFMKSMTMTCLCTQMNMCRT